MDIKNLLAIAKITPNLELDQFFLQDDNVLNEEVDLAKLGKKDTVLEIGPGIGNLTILLSKKAGSVIAVEKDYAFSHVLKNIPNTQVVLGDVLEFLESLRSKYDTKDERGSKKPSKMPSVSPFNKIVSNIPYSISQPLVLEMFRHKWEIAVLIVQKEFAEKLVSKERLGLVLSELADIKIVKKIIPASSFYPVAVPSSVVVMKQKNLLDYDFWVFVSSLKPNKDVSNQVKKYPKPLAKKKVHQLTLAELKELYKNSNK